MTDPAPLPFQPHRFRDAAAHYLSGRVPYPERLVARVAALVGLDPSADEVLDLGCGPGQLACLFAPHAAGVLALDPEPAMLRLAAEQARPFGDRVRVRTGSSYDLSPALGRFRLCVIGRAFHWMDRADALRRLDSMIEPDGAVALFHDTHPDLPENAWLARFHAVRARLAGGGPDWKGPGWVRHEAPLLDGPFPRLDVLGVVERRQVTVAGMVERALSLSSTFRAPLGEGAPGVAAAVTEALSPLATDGVLWEVVRTEALVARRPA